ncbi:DUF4422 domain-containing protein [Winogradskyella sp. DF17]|uniref:DUF4422 domain-containing protein n=1 Tax=Winogradskyella pelagia TaxID=2819984 RepID=A0ABS3T0D1_9FLAO|nr:DUF4422 domain-containing protein [Winogradskyella sp. DF17]MBO3116196.1 DUF4422 domain-containing protein [Winogradskyella sp. DF17]
MVKIFVVTHKPVPPLVNDLYQTIRVNPGTEEHLDDAVLIDNTGDNISGKNDNYCELTAAYWIAKNYHDADYVGLCHYRRYFNLYKNLLSFSPSTQKRVSLDKFKKSKLYRTTPKKQEEHIEKILKDYDVILPIHYTVGHEGKKVSLSENYAIGHRKEDFDLTKQIILEKYPKYEDSITSYLDDSSRFYVANMFIASKTIFNDYYKWLFDVLFELERRIDIPTDNYQKRIFGFISERLTAMYFWHHNFKIKEMPLYHITD